MMWTLYDGLYVEADAPGEEPVSEFDIWPLVPLYPVRWKEPTPTLIVSKPTSGPGDEEKQGKTWIEIRLIDDAGDPMAEERYILQFPDGHTEENKLDGKGRAHLEGIDPGPYIVSFPDIGYTTRVS